MGGQQGTDVPTERLLDCSLSLLYDKLSSLLQSSSSNNCSLTTDMGKKKKYAIGNTYSAEQDLTSHIQFDWIHLDHPVGKQVTLRFIVKVSNSRVKPSEGSLWRPHITHDTHMTHT